MSDKRDTVVNVEREPTHTVYTERESGSGGLIAALVILVLVIAALAFIFLQPGSRPGETNVTIDSTSPPAVTAPSQNQAAPDTDTDVETPAPAEPAQPAEPAPAAPEPAQ